MHVILGLSAVFFVAACASSGTSAGVASVGPAALETTAATRAKAAPTIPLGDCLAERKATLFLNCYVPESATQLEVLGADAAKVRMVMCLTCMDVYGDNEECHANQIQDYPTWIFPDGTRLTGLQGRDALIRAAQCDKSTAAAP